MLSKISKPNKIILWMLVLFVVIGGVRAYVVLNRIKGFDPAIPSVLIMSFLVFVWCRVHATANNINAPKWAAFLCALIAVIGVPLYFFRAYGFRKGAIATLRALGVFVLLVFVSALTGAGVGLSEYLYHKYGPAEGAILRYGIYERVSNPVSARASRVPTIYFSEKSGKYNYLERTSTIHMKKNLCFGYDYRLSGLGEDTSPALEEVFYHPVTTNDKGVSAKVTRVPLRVHTTTGSVNGYIVYCLVHDYDMVPGKWNLKINYGNRTLVEKKFILSD